MASVIPTGPGLGPKDKAVLGCFALFALPFAGVGVFSSYQTVAYFVQGRVKDGFFSAVFAICFGMVGFGLLFAALKAPAAQRKDNARKAANPDAPWLWREEWADGRIKSANGPAMAGAWIFAIFWNALSSGIWLILPRELKRGNYEILIALLFPLVGLGLLVWAIHATLRWRRFGQSWFVLQHNPGFVGGQLAGTVETSLKVRPRSGFQVRLTCHRHDNRGESNAQTLLWEDEKRIVKDPGDPRHTRIPIFFQIPPEVSPSDDRDSSLRTIWRLEVRGEMEGPDYFAQFEVPVFAPGKVIPPPPPATDPTLAFQPPPQPYRQPVDSKIKVRGLTSGAREFYFPAGRNPGPTLATLAFIAVWSSVICLMIAKRAPLAFPIIFGLFDLLFIAIFLNFLLKSTRVTIRQRGLDLEQRWLFYARRQHFAPGEITAVNSAIGMTSGQTVYHDLHAHTAAGRKVSLAGSIKDRREARWLAEEMNRALGLDNAPSAPNIRPV
jgi:hypothetical protein